MDSRDALGKAPYPSLDKGLLFLLGNLCTEVSKTGTKLLPSRKVLEVKMKGGGRGFLGGCVSGWGGPLLCRAKRNGKESLEQRNIRDLRSPLWELPLASPGRTAWQ